MYLRPKSLLVAGLSFAVLATALFATSHWVVVRRCEDLDRQRVHQAVKRALAAINEDLKRLDTLATTYAVWEESQPSGVSDDASVPTPQLTAANLRRLEVDAALWVQPGQPIAGLPIGPEGGQASAIIRHLAAKLVGNSPLMQHDHPGNIIQGLLSLPEGLLLVVSRPIGDTHGLGRGNGTLVMGRLLDAAGLQRFSDVVQLPLGIYSLAAGGSPPADVRQAHGILKNGIDIEVLSLNTEFAGGYARLPEVTGGADIVLRVEVPRDSYQQGRTSQVFLLAALLVMVAGAGVVVLVQSNQQASGGLREFTQILDSIAASRDLGTRVTVGGPELTALGEAINRMLTSLELAQQGLRLQERTQELTVANQALLAKIAEHCRTEKALQQERDQAQQYLDTAGVLIMALDQDGRITLINRKGCDILGYEESELLGRNWFETFLPSHVINDATHAFEQLMAGHLDTAQYCENAVLAKDGTERLIAFHNVIIRNETGEIVGALAAGEEITQRKHMKEALQTSEEQLRSLINAMPDLVCLKDADGRWVEANDFYLRLFELQDFPYKGKTCRELAAASDRYRDIYLYCMDSDENAWRLGTVSRSETVLARPDQPAMTFDVIRLPLFYPDGRRKGLVMVGRDITARKHAEQDRILLSQAVEQVKESIIITDADGIIRYVNTAFETLSGLTRDRLLGIDPSTITASADASTPSHSELWSALSWEKTWSGYIQHHSPNGQVCDIEVTVLPILHESGFINSYVTVMRDVTNELNLEKQLRQVQKMEAIGTLAGGIAHDFNNILTPIIIYAEMGLYDMSEDNPLRYPLEQILQAGSRAKELVKQILAFSRQDEKERRPMRVSIIAKEALRLLRASIPSTIEIRQTIPAESGAIMADPVQIHQILMNLCANAAHAMRAKGGVLGIALEDVALDADTCASLGDIKPGLYVRLTVSDNGHGMTPDVLERIFDPYFTTKKHGEGTGMGLAVVHGIVKRYHGAITVNSAPDQGTTFQIWLPRCDVPATPVEKDRLPYPTGRESILFVDDESGLVSMAKIMLERLGYQVTVQTSSMDALELFRAQPQHFDLIITDFTMPNMTGLDLTREILKIRSNIPIVLCTGFSELLTPEDAKAIGIREIMLKPIHTRQVAETIRRSLDQSSQNA